MSSSRALSVKLPRLSVMEKQLVEVTGTFQEVFTSAIRHPHWPGKLPSGKLSRSHTQRNGSFREGFPVCTTPPHLDSSGRLTTFGFPRGPEGKASACSAGDLGSILGLGRSPGGWNGNPLWYSCLEKPMDGGAWWAIVHGVAKSRTWLSDSTCTFFTFIRVEQDHSWFFIDPDHRFVPLALHSGHSECIPCGCHGFRILWTWAACPPGALKSSFPPGPS